MATVTPTSDLGGTRILQSDFSVSSMSFLYGTAPAISPGVSAGLQRSTHTFQYQREKVRKVRLPVQRLSRVLSRAVPTPIASQALMLAANQ